jgi:hypothetical protein
VADSFAPSNVTGALRVHKAKRGSTLPSCNAFSALRCFGSMSARKASVSGLIIRSYRLAGLQGDVQLACFYYSYTVLK